MSREPRPRERVLYDLLCGQIQLVSWLEANLHYLTALVDEKVHPAYRSRYVKDSRRLIEEARLSFPRWEEVAPLGLDLAVRLRDHLRRQQEGARRYGPERMDLRGRTRRRLDGLALLQAYDELRARAREFLREHPYPVGHPGQRRYWDLALGFPEADLKDLELLEQRKPGAFAEAVLARQQGRTRNWIHKCLTSARRAAGRSRAKTRVA